MDIPFSIALLKAGNAQSHRMRPQLAELGLSVGQPRLLAYLRRHDGCMQKELAAFCGVEAATISRMLAAMERQGMIRRELAAGNKRAAAVFLTEEGRRLSGLVLDIRGRVEAQGLEGFSPREQALFYQFLTRYRDNLMGAAGERPSPAEELRSV